MDATDRASRQLMRQRGAGLRNNNNVDFGLEFGTHGSREDRQLMRQRGAGNRKIDNIDFGFSFPTPNQSRRSSRTPQTSRRGVLRSSKTPASGRNGRTSTTQPNQVASGDVDEAQTSVRKPSSTPQRATEAERSNSSKKRKLNSGDVDRKASHITVNIPVLPHLDAQPLPSIEAQTNDLYLASDASLNQRSDDHEEYPPRMSSPLFIPESNKENADFYETDLGLLKSMQKQRRSNFGLGELRNGAVTSRPISPNGSIELSAEDFPLSEWTKQINYSEVPDTGIEPSEVLDAESEGQLTPSIEPQSRIMADTSAKQPRRKRKRKSVILGPRKRKSLEGKQKNVTAAKEPSSTLDPESLDESLAPEDETDEEQPMQEGQTNSEGSTERVLPLWKQLVARKAQGRQSRLSVPTSPPRDAQDDEEGDETYVDDADEDVYEELATPAEKRRKATGHAKTKERRPRSSDKGESRTKAKRNTFPILTHRITNTQALPTIMEEDEHEHIPDEDVELLPPAFSNRTQPNAIDILAQICRETVQSAIENVATNSTAGRAEIKTKRAALEAFRESLDQRLFEMSEAVENRINLEARLRKSKREKAELQARWMEVRRRRDELALRADIIRRQNWDNEEEGKRQWEISELAHSTELEVERNEPDEEGNLELMLKVVGKSMSQAGGQATILNRVRAFNSHLERIALALER